MKYVDQDNDSDIPGDVFSNDGRTMYVIDYGEVFTDFQMTPQFYTVPKSGVIWTITYGG